MMTHEEANELLASLALDAVDADEREAIELHVEECPRCRGELDALREVAGALGNVVEQVPEGQWSSISGRLYEGRDGDAAPPPRLLPLVGRDADRHELRDRRPAISRRAGVVFAAVTVAAAIAIAALVVSLSSANDQIAHLQGALAESSQSAVVAALETPGHKLVNLEGSNHADLAQFVLLPDGRGYLVKADMPALPTKDTYQLWGIIGGRPISIGIMGQAPGTVTFTIAGSPGPSDLAVTVEPAGGTPAPTTTPVAVGPV